jgi:hypothetical protein
VKLRAACASNGNVSHYHNVTMSQCHNVTTPKRHTRQQWTSNNQKRGETVSGVEGGMNVRREKQTYFAPKEAGELISNNFVSPLFLPPLLIVCCSQLEDGRRFEWCPVVRGIIFDLRYQSHQSDQLEVTMMSSCFG